MNVITQMITQQLAGSASRQIAARAWCQRNHGEYGGTDSRAASTLTVRAII